MAHPQDLVKSINVTDSWKTQYYAYNFGDNPGANQTVCSITGLPSGWYDITAYMSIKITATNSSIRLAWLDYTGSNKLWFLMHGREGYTEHDEVHLHNIYLNSNDQLAIVIGEAFTGSYSGAILAVRRY